MLNVIVNIIGPMMKLVSFNVVLLEVGLSKNPSTTLSEDLLYINGVLITLIFACITLYTVFELVLQIVGFQFSVRLLRECEDIQPKNEIFVPLLRDVVPDPFQCYIGHIEVNSR